MNKKIILTITVLFLAVCFAGPVSAETVDDNQETVSQETSENVEPVDEQADNVTITGEVLKCSDGLPFNGVTVTASANGETLASTITGENGRYRLNLITTSTNLLVTATATGHNPVSKELVISRDPDGSVYASADFTLGVGDTYVYGGWATNPDEMVTFPDGSTLNKSYPATYTTIKDGVDNVDIGKIVYVAPGIYNEALIINKNLNLIGENQSNTIIDGSGLNNSVITIINGIVTIKNFTIQNSQISATDNVAYAQGGGIYNSGTLTIENCTIRNNKVTATSEGGDAYALGGGIYNCGTLTITNSTIQSNNATATLSFNRVARAFGGGIYNDGTLNIKNCTIKNNNTTANAMVRANTLSIGGGISNFGTLTIENSKLENNTSHATNVDLLSFAGGGGIYCSGTSYIYDSIIQNNTATAISENGYPEANGGGIFNSSTLTIENSIIKGNTATATSTNNNGGAVGGGIHHQSGTLIIKNCNIQNNIVNATSTRVDGYADVFGGGIMIQTGMSTIENSTIQGNTATATNLHRYAFAQGGGISSLNSIVTIKNSNVKDNQNNAIADTARARGGGIYSTGTINIENSTIQNNNNTATSQNGTADASGGGIYNGSDIDSGNLTIKQSTIKNNTNNVTNNNGTADASGGGIYNQYGTLTANYNRIVDNSPNAVFNLDSADVMYNWWGSNNPSFDTLIVGTDNYTPWLYMTINANPNIINNGGQSTITSSFNNLYDGKDLNPLDPSNGHIPDGTPVIFNTDKGSIGSKTIEKQSTTGIATATLNADETGGVAHINAVTDDQTVNVDVTVKPKSTLYLAITGKKNISVGETVTYTLKVGNRGPDMARDVVMTYQIPRGLEFAGASVDKGSWSYKTTTRTLTWNIGDVPVGDPYLWLDLKILKPGTYQVNPQLSTSTYDPTIDENTESITVNAAEKPGPRPEPVNGKSVPMQKTGTPIAILVLAVLMVAGGIVSSKK
ncbi:MAG: hypothetical protein Kow0019_15630 [Methanobacteriaceae archaeon]